MNGSGMTFQSKRGPLAAQARLLAEALPRRQSPCSQLQRHAAQRHYGLALAEGKELSPCQHQHLRASAAPPLPSVPHGALSLALRAWPLCSSVCTNPDTPQGKKVLAFPVVPLHRHTCPETISCKSLLRAWSRSPGSTAPVEAQAAHACVPRWSARRAARPAALARGLPARQRQSYA